MKIDEDLLETLEKTPILHLYDWEGPSATYGYFISPEKHLDLAAARRHNLSLARRPTGGGIVFHIWDYAFSFLMPESHPLFSNEPLKNYRFVNGVVLEAIKELFSLQDAAVLIPQTVLEAGEDCQNFCMAKPTQYDVVYQGMKIAGAAQRKTKRGYLHQGTISLGLPQKDLLQAVLLSKKDVLEAMQRYTFAPMATKDRAAASHKLAEYFKKSV